MVPLVESPEEAAAAPVEDAEEAELVMLEDAAVDVPVLAGAVDVT
jgi:hypothetical protein